MESALFTFRGVLIESARLETKQHRRTRDCNHALLEGWRTSRTWRLNSGRSLRKSTRSAPVTPPLAVGARCAGDGVPPAPRKAAPGESPSATLPRPGCWPPSVRLQAHILEGSRPGKGLIHMSAGYECRLLHTRPDGARPDVELDGPNVTRPFQQPGDIAALLSLDTLQLKPRGVPRGLFPRRPAQLVFAPGMPAKTEVRRLAPCRLDTARARPGRSRSAGAGNPIRPRDTSDSHRPR